MCATAERRAGGADARRHRHHEQPGDDGEIAHAVQKETPAFADDRDEMPGDRRTDDARAVDHRGIERDGVHQVLAPDHLER